MNESNSQSQPLLVCENVKKYFPLRSGLLAKSKNYARAVDGVSFTLNHSETLGLVGESGCGKSTLARTLLRLIPPTDGRALFEGTDIFSLNEKQFRPLRRHIQIIFQDPLASLNPRMNVENIVGEAVSYHGIARGREKKELVANLLEKVGLRPEQAKRYPHEFSGGQRQRIGVARALAMNPKLIIADEPVSALDVSVQAQVINLLIDLQKEFSLSYLFISHDLRVVEHVADRVAVMYLGQIVELGWADQIYNSPWHPYTVAMLEAMPRTDPNQKKAGKSLTGDIPSPVQIPAGCRFHPRCPKKFSQCTQLSPDLKMVKKGHWVRCHLYD
ncbi:MAG: dipeptide ABC transporter ATP-binding protein [Calditrichaeota bacterium]|nr:dipeptide ABC transporter ATP-binding protein [Calditrichota bacterium]